MQARIRRRMRDAPAWFAVGILLHGAAAGPPRSAVGEEHDPRLPARAAGELDADARNARELRSLPGIGPARAVQIVRARRDGLRGGPAAWRALPGIGDAIAAQAAEALRVPAMETPSERAYTRRDAP